jgi:superfamily II DNA or RNA helicase
MPKRTSPAGGDLFIVDNSDEDWKVQRYLHDWCQISKGIDIATGYFEIGALLALKDEWQKVDHIRILMGDEVSIRTRDAIVAGLDRIKGRLDASIENEKENNDFLAGVPAVVDGLKSDKITCRVYRKGKFHAKAYITHARLEVVGASALVGSSNFTHPGMTENIELNVQITGRPVNVLQEWYEEHWNEAEPVTPEILATVERHVREYPPFDVYARALHEFFRRHVLTDLEWFRDESRMYQVLDRYQRDGFHELIDIARRYRGAFLCDGVGLGKTFIGLMLIEYLVERLRKRVVLIVPKSGRKPVWEQALGRYLPHLFRRDFSSLAIFNHTDLLRQGEFTARLHDVTEMADAVILDEAHHFRNPGLKGDEDDPRSRYWKLYGLVGEKQLFLLTATPVNNRLLDLQHMIELFSRRQADYFKAAPLGIHSLPGHFRKLEKDLQQSVFSGGRGIRAPEQESGAETVVTDEPDVNTNEVEAERVLRDDTLFRSLVVQRSRAYVKRSQEQHSTGSARAIFPSREDPRVIPYDLKQTYGKLLERVEKAFSKEKPLFSLAMYCPLAYYCGPDKSIDPLRYGRQREVASLIRIQFLKRFESSCHAFELSCQTMLQKLLAFVVKNHPTGETERRLERWKRKHDELIGYVHDVQQELWGTTEEEEAEEDLVDAELLEHADELSREEYRVEDMLHETLDDLEEVAGLLEDLRGIKPTNDDKLRALLKLLKGDSVLKKHKVIIFSEFRDTARYLEKQLKAAGIKGVDEVDSGSDRDRGEIIRQFAPYYNGSSSAALKEDGLEETRVLISTDVLAEGLNLQDATRLINYDLHWNPVRLMQRIGRIDRRLNSEVEARLVTDHPEVKDIRGTAAYWNFIPPGELDNLLKLYGRVAHKTLRISKTFGIEGRKLLKPDDDFEDLRDFTHAYEGEASPLENLHLEYQVLLHDHPDLEKRLDSLPRRLFSGKAHPTPGSRAVFFCFAMPAPDEAGHWSENCGETRWYLHILETEVTLTEPTQIATFVRSAPETPRKCELPTAELSTIRARVEKHIKNTYLRQVQAPIGVKPSLRAWMELS